MTPADFHVPFERFDLPNGMPVVVAPLPHVQRAHIAWYVRTGSRFETEATNGISHFLEHMIYRGTKKLPSAHEVNLAFEDLGGYLHAATQVDYAVFSVTLPKENLEKACALFADVLHAPLFLDIELEKGIVCEEILEDMDDDGRQVDADNLSRELIYDTHPLGYTITGTDAQVRSFDEALLRFHHERHHGSRSSVLAITGAIDPKVARAVAEREFAGFQDGTRVAADAPQHAQKKPRVRIVSNLSSQTELRICFRAIPENAPEVAALDCLMRAIDDGMSTRLYHRLCDSQGLCYDVSAGYDGFEDDGIVDFAAGVQHKRVALVTREILALFREIAAHGVTDAELDKVRRRIGWELRALRDSPEDIGAVLAGGILFNRFETPDEIFAKSMSVTAKGVMNVARTICTPERLNAVAVGHLDASEEARFRDAIASFKV